MITVFKTSYLKIIAIMIIMFGSVLTWMYQHNINEFNNYHTQLAKESANGVAGQISSFIRERNRLVEVFSNEYIELIRDVILSPENEEILKRLALKVRKYFPNYFAFTVSDLDGNTYFLDFDGFVLEKCISDLKTFSRKKNYSPYIHPNPNAYHFDIMTHFGDSLKPEGIFFVSFHADILGRILLNSKTPNHKLLLIYPEKQDLIEVLEGGARNIIVRNNYRISESEQSRILIRTPVTGTRWQAIDMYDINLFKNYENKLMLQYVIIFVIFSVLGLHLVVRLRHEEKQRLDAEHHKDTLLSYITHEFRTPLTTIMNALGLLDDKNNTHILPAEKRQGLIDASLRNARQLRYLVDDFLEIRKLESHGFKLNIQRTDLCDTIKECIENNRYYAKQQNIDFIYSSSQQNFFVRADSNRICQVVSNFLSNAVKYGGANKKINIHIEGDNGKVKVSVTDYGPGIKKTFIAYLFQQFAVGHTLSTSTSPSTGLGLSICKTIIEQHHGDIGYKTADDCGAIFYFLLPLDV